MSPSKLALKNSYQKNIIKNSRARQIVESSNCGIVVSWHQFENMQIQWYWNHGIIESWYQFKTCKSSSLGIVES